MQRQTDTETDRNRDRQIQRQIETETDRYRHRQIQRQTRQIHRKTDTETDRYRDRQIQIHAYTETDRIYIGTQRERQKVEKILIKTRRKRVKEKGKGEATIVIQEKCVNFISENCLRIISAKVQHKMCLPNSVEQYCTMQEDINGCK